MKVTTEDVSPTRKILTVAIDAEEITAEESQVVQEFASQAKLPGFRPGKAPAKLVRSKFGKDIREEVNRKVTSHAYEFALKETDVKLFSVINLEGDELKIGEPGELKFTLDVEPEFEVPAYKGLTVEVEPVEVTDEEVHQAIEDLRNQRADYKEVDRAAEKGDYVRCAYTGKIGDALIADLAPDASMYGTQHATWEEAGAEDAPGVKAVVDGLVGMAKGDRKTVEMTFPEDIEHEALRGKTATYDIEVTEVREKVLPEMDEAFLKSLQAESLEELKENFHENLKNRKQQQANSEKRSQITRQLGEAVDFPLPQSAVEGETEQILREVVEHNVQRGVAREELEKQKDQLYENAAKGAQDRVKLRMILAKIADKETIEVQNEDFSQVIMQQAMMTRQQPDKIVEELKKDRARVQALRQDILMNKTLDYLVEQAEVKETAQTS
ncbi:MAG: trigger factor [Opitutales bacterium]